MSASTMSHAGLSEASRATLVATIDVVGAHIDEISQAFYHGLLLEHPELLKHLFNRGNQAQGAQQRALAASVVTFARHLLVPGAPDPVDMMRRVGHKHVSLGVTREQYTLVHDHLMRAVGEVLGEAATMEVAAAWSDLYWVMASSLIRLEDELYRGAGLQPGHVFRTVEVVGRTELPGSAAVFELAGLQGQWPLGSIRPGQYVSLRRQLPDGAGQLRQFSLCSSADDPTWQVAVRKVRRTLIPDGVVSTSIIGGLRVGDRVQVSHPFGSLLLDEHSTRPLVLVSNGIALAPMLSMVRTLADRGSQRRVLVMHADEQAQAAPLVDEMVADLARLPHGEARLWFAAGRRHGSTLGRMRLDMPLPADADVYVCGSNAFIHGAREDLLAQGIEASRIRHEFFLPNDWLLTPEG